MCHPWDDPLIVFALRELARDHRGTPTQQHAIDLGITIATHHGLVFLEID